jgi:HEAT repeat protein
MAVAHAVALMLAGSFAWPGGASGPGDLGARDEGARVRAVLALTGADDGQARTLLVPMLRDRDAGVRETAARLLARRGATEATEAATGWVAGTVARDRLIGLHVLRDAPELTPAARRAVERATRDGDLATRGQALDVLGSHEPAASFGVVLAALGDEHRDVRARAARVLGELRDARAAVPLIARLEDGDRQVRIESIVALGAFGAAGERRVVPALLRQLQPQTDAGTPDLRAPAIGALSATGDPAAVPGLVALARRRPRDELARQAILALGSIATPEALEAVRTLAREPETLDDAREALARAGDRALPVLRAELAGGTPSVAAMAADLLGALSDRRATPWLAEAVEAGGPAARPAAAALARLGDDAAVPTLLRCALARARSVDLRVAAFDALAALRDDRAAEGLEAALGDPEAAVRAAAARAAGACGGPALAPALAARLNDADARVRRDAARSLARLAAPSSDVTRAIVAALVRSRGALAEGVGDALGEALERSARPSDAAAIEQAYVDTAKAAANAAKAAANGSALAPLARALAAVHADEPLTSRPVIEALMGELGGDDGRAMSAADALSTARFATDQADALAAAFSRAEAGVAARLAPALASFGVGARQLAATLREPRAGATRRAAAAWALAGVPEGDAALREALTAAEPSVAANARAALAAGVGARARRSGPRWAAVRLVTATGEPWPRQWLTVTPAGGSPIWTLTDLDGRARIDGAGPAPVVAVP